MNYSIKEIKKIIDEQKIDKSCLSGYGITTCKFCMQFFDPIKQAKQYKEIYNYLFNRFVAFEKGK